MRVRAVLLAALIVVAACGGPSGTASTSGVASHTAPVALDTPSPASSATAASPRPAASPQAACGTTSMAVTPPDPPAGTTQSIDGLTSAGELLLIQGRVADIGDTILVYDPGSGTIKKVVARKPAKSIETATSQVARSAGTADWIVWEETGFTLDVGDWVMWAQDRHTGKVRKVASFEPGSDGQALPGFPSDISVRGNVAAWSARFQLANGHVQERIYVADLAAHTTKRLEPVARWPSVVSPTALVAAVATGLNADRLIISEPAEVAIADGAVTPQGITEPDRLVALAASPSGTVVFRVVRESSAEVPGITDAIVRLDGTVRVFPLLIDWGVVGAGDGFLAWTDQLHLWMLTSGQDKPVQLAEVADDMGNLRMRAAGPYLFWHTDAAVDRPEANTLVTVHCP